MSESKRTFRHESLESAAILADHLTEIAAAVRSGTLRLEDDEGELSLSPSGLVRFELTGFEEAGEGGLRLSLSWRETDNESKSTLKISRNVGDRTAGS